MLKVEDRVQVTVRGSLESGRIVAIDGGVAVVECDVPEPEVGIRDTLRVVRRLEALVPAT